MKRLHQFQALKYLIQIMHHLLVPRKQTACPKMQKQLLHFFLGAFTANICGYVLPIKLGLSRYWKISKIIVIQNRSPKCSILPKTGACTNFKTVSNAAYNKPHNSLQNRQSFFPKGSKTLSILSSIKYVFLNNLLLLGRSSFKIRWIRKTTPRKADSLLQNPAYFKINASGFGNLWRNLCRFIANKQLL